MTDKFNFCRFKWVPTNSDFWHCHCFIKFRNNFTYHRTSFSSTLNLAGNMVIFQDFRLLIQLFDQLILTSPLDVTHKLCSFCLPFNQSGAPWWKPRNNLTLPSTGIIVVNVRFSSILVQDLIIYYPVSKSRTFLELGASNTSQKHILMNFLPLVGNSSF